MTDIKKLKYYINSQEKMINAIVSYLDGGMRNDLEVLKRIVEHLEEKPTEKKVVVKKGLRDLTNLELGKKISKVIRSYMKRMHYTTCEMAEVIGISKSSLYSKLYGCDTSLNVRELKGICDELLLSIDDVINEAENEKIEKI